MANAKYPKFKEALLKADIAGGLDAVDVIGLLIDLNDYTYHPADEFIADIPGAAIVARSGNLTSKTFTNGVFSSASFTFSAVVGDSCEAVILAVDTGDDATSRLIAYWDSGVTGLPLTPNGEDVNVVVNPSGLFSI